VLVLASTSPQRRAILEQLRIAFVAVVPAYHETRLRGASPIELVRAHAEGKARSVYGDGRFTIGVDTAVHLGDIVFGKPASAADAARMLRRLSGTAHTVLSAICLLGPGVAAVEHEATTVVFRTLSKAEIRSYVDSGEWRERAGGYAIQGLGGRLVTRVEGDYLNVVGLPAALLVTLLGRFAPDLLEIS
jgi:septum formation protein